ncbi:unnamed protein product [Phytophthora fragariaefolia]|uniref:Unnamed protein product n=1 Tax=Phytophthora fragariaefolia TaxID=1490495 RepID=A0A9W6WTN7_9STRA|nr:unnamed protein product [Phytophthora fragariaefolia]
MVRKSKYPHSSPALCVWKPIGKWRLVHAYNKLNSATVPSQTPIPRKDVLLNNMAGCTLYSALYLVDGYYQIRMRELEGKNGQRHDPGKVRVTNEWPTPSNVKELRQFLGLATYLCKYMSNYAVKQDLAEAPNLVVADQDCPFHVVCDASDFAIGCALMQHDHEGCDRVVYFQSRQLKPAERNYPVHDKEPLVIKYALAKFRVYLLGSRPFVVYTDHASLRTAIKSPHISKRMAKCLSFLVEFNFQAEPAPMQFSVVRTSTPSSALLDDVRSAYASAADAKQLLDYFAASSDKPRQKLPKHPRVRVHRYRVHNDLLLYSAVDDNADRVVVPDDHELNLRITYEYHDVPTSGHPGREKVYFLLTGDFY